MNKQCDAAIVSIVTSMSDDDIARIGKKLFSDANLSVNESTKIFTTHAPDMASRRDVPIAYLTTKILRIAETNGISQRDLDLDGMLFYRFEYGYIAGVPLKRKGKVRTWLGRFLGR